MVVAPLSLRMRLPSFTPGSHCRSIGKKELILIRPKHRQSGRQSELAAAYPWNSNRHEFHVIVGDLLDLQIRQRRQWPPCACQTYSQSRYLISVSVIVSTNSPACSRVNSSMTLPHPRADTQRPTVDRISFLSARGYGVPNPCAI